MEQNLCDPAQGAGYGSVAGTTGCLDPRELKDSDFYLIWGSNVKATRIHTMPVLEQARRNGKKVVLIKVCSWDMEPYCDQTVLVRPGTDGAAKAPSILMGSGLSRQGNGGMATRLITILSAYTGAWGCPGGGFCGCNPNGGRAYVEAERITRPDWRTHYGLVLNMNQLASALNSQEKGRKISSVLVYGSNPVNSVCNQTQIIKGLEREDLFTVVHERFMTDTARYADLVLPATFSVEQSDCYGSYGYCTFGTAYKILEAPGQCKSNWDLFRLLADGMGYQDAYFHRTAEEVLKELLEHPAEGLKQIAGEERQVLRDGGVISVPFADYHVFRTPSGKLQLVDENQAVPVPCYMENYGARELREQNQHGQRNPVSCGWLHLINVPSFYTLNSIFLERPGQTEKRGGLQLLLNSQDAEARGISTGDRVMVSNDLAEVEFLAVVTDKAAVGAAVTIGIHNRKTSGQHLQGNALHHERLTDMGEATTLNDNLVMVRRA